VECQHFNRE
jgi:small nuclear ribonucleoprotein (snRNP)-like protein